MNEARRYITGILVVSVCAISCGLVSPSSDELLSVDTRPPGAHAIPMPIEPRAEPQRMDPVSAAVLEHIAQFETGLVEAEEEELARTIAAEALRHGIEPKLILAVMTVESRFDNFALSKVGAMGLMQVMPQTGEEVAGQLGIPWRGSHTLFDPIANVRIGIAYLKHLADRYQSMPTALAAYNWGPTHIDRRLSRGTPIPTRYPRLVTEAFSTTLLKRSS